MGRSSSGISSLTHAPASGGSIFRTAAKSALPLLLQPPAARMELTVDRSAHDREDTLERLRLTLCLSLPHPSLFSGMRLPSSLPLPRTGFHDERQSKSLAHSRYNGGDLTFAFPPPNSTAGTLSPSRRAPLSSTVRSSARSSAAARRIHRHGDRRPIKRTASAGGWPTPPVRNCRARCCRCGISRGSPQHHPSDDVGG